MLRIYSVALDVAGDAARVAAVIHGRDADLARQLRRAAASVALNISEGCYSQKGNRVARYYNALGSARETLSCLELSVAMGLMPRADAGTVAKLNHIIGTLVNITKKAA